MTGNLNSILVEECKRNKLCGNSDQYRMAFVNDIGKRCSDMKGNQQLTIGFDQQSVCQEAAYTSKECLYTRAVSFSFSLTEIKEFFFFFWEK